MLDPLTALSVTGNVVQFVEFGTSVLREAYLLYTSKDGTTSVNQELGFVVGDLLKLVAKLRRDGSQDNVAMSNSETEQELESLCVSCTNIAQEMIGRLRSRDMTHGRVWASLSEAIQSAWNRTTTDALMNRLSVIKEAVEFRILVQLREKLDGIELRADSRFDKLDGKTQEVITALLNTRNALTVDVQIQTRAIAQMLSGMEVAVLSQQDQTRTIIIDTLRRYDNLDPKNMSSEEKWEKSVTKAFEKEEKGLKFDVEHKLLKSLTFPTMHDRIDEISEEHTNTFGWVFDETQPVPWDHFGNWLKESEGLYWVNGKAASGNGTPEQRSLTGFLKTLLYEVLSKRRDLISVLLPRFWAETYSELLRRPGHHAAAIWKSSDLIRALKALADPSIVDIRLFLLIDGLDEYEGQQEEYEAISELLCEIGSSPNIKICVSSRPLLVFEDAFIQHQGLRLQDLTYQDIKEYVSERLGGHQRFQLIAAKEPDRAPKLLDEIVDKANGVFLWVRLVVQSLIAGLRNRDSISDLQRRLLLLLADLEDLYTHMMGRIESFYMVKASEMFQLVRAQGTRESTFRAMPLEQEVFTILALAMADHEYPSQILERPIGVASLEAVIESCSEMVDRLKVRCAGLLELQGQEGFTNVTTVQEVHWHAKVQYIHRTARDYIESEHVWQSLIAQTRDTDFNAYVSLFRSGVLQLKQLAGLFKLVGNRNEMVQIARNTLNYASLIECHWSDSNVALVDTINAAMSHFYKAVFPSNARHWASDVMYPNEYGGSSFLSLTIQCNLQHYVKQTLDRNPSLAKKKLDRPFLLDAVTPWQRPGPAKYSQIHPDIARCLLEHGANPNECAPFKPIWEQFLDWQTKYNLDVREGIAHNDVEFSRNRATVMRLMIENGAQDSRRWPQGFDFVLSLAKEFMPVAPDEAKRTVNLLTNKQLGKHTRKKSILRLIFNRQKQ
ncbi:hypothetical protein BDZ45DRAFT_731282 [Acephala macrosclerotiorum]|nr:hypothetical protein BDZ45DRAFT_731282 [Acephala macrosclerotiorum]